MSSLSARLRRQPPTTSVLQYLSIFAMMATSRNKLNMFLALLVLGPFVADCFSFFLPSLRIDRIVQGSRDSYQPSLVTRLDSKSSSSRFPSRMSILLAGRSSNNEVASKIDERSNGKGPSKNTKKNKKPAKDWYAILGATPSMNKYEIKKLYVQLAKETHPDSSSDGPTPESIEKFNDVAQAWSILSDPKSKRAYDRERAADKMRDDIVDYVSDAAREYGPQLGKFYDEFAIPLLKRTTASTLAGFRAVSGEVARGGSDRKGGGNKNGKQTSTLLEKEKEAMEEKFNESGKTTALSDFGRAFQKVIEAGQNATRQIDAEELKIKSIELRKEADEARIESLETLERLASIKSERLRLTFHTSSANFTSVEALQFLDGFNTLDEVTLMDRMTFKHTISHDIEAFSEAENEFNKKALEKKRMDLQVKSKGIEYERAVRNLKEAELAEARARKMLEDAIKNVAESQTKLADAQRAVTDINSASKRTDQELDKSYSILKRKRDIVRRALKRKEEKEGLPQNNKQVIVSVANNSTGEIANKTATAKKSGKSMAALGFEKQNVLAIEELRKEEARTESEFLRLVDRASRLVSRSERLRLRSEALIGQQTIIDESTSNLIQNTTSLEKTEISKEIKNATKGMKDAEKTNLAISNVVAKSV